MYRRLFNSFRILKNRFCTTTFKRLLLTGLCLKTLANTHHRSQEDLIEEQEHIQMRDDFIHKNLIIYNCQNEQVDPVIRMLLETYAKNCEDHNLKIIFLKASTQQTKQLPMMLVVMRRYSQDPQFIDLEYIRSISRTFEEFTANVIKRLSKKLEEPKQININTLHKLDTILNKDYYMTYVLKTNQDSKEYILQRKTFEEFKQKSLLFEKANFVICDDEVGARVLGMDGNQDGTISALTPIENPNLKDLTNSYRIGNTSYKQVNQLTNTSLVQSTFIFPPIAKEQKPYTLQISLNKNTLKQNQVSFFYELFSGFKNKDIGLQIGFTNSVDTFEVQLRKNEDLENQIFERDSKSKLTNQEKIKYLTTSRVYRYNSLELNEVAIASWIDRVLDKKQDPYYKSEPLPPYERYSAKLTANTFKQKILDSPSDDLIFYFSNTCSSCKKFGKIYENIARDMRMDKSIRFYHLNNQKNKMSCGHNYNYTPVFAYYKKQHKSSPFLYKRPYFSPSLFKDFIEITRELTLIDEDAFNTHIQSHLK